MAIDIQVIGASRLYYGPPINPTSWRHSQGAWTALGTTETGIEVETHIKAEDQYCDEMGGREGTPYETLWLGELAYLRGVLVRYDKAKAEEIMTGLCKVTGNTLPLPGIRMRYNGMMFSLAAVSPKRVNNNQIVDVARVWYACRFAEPVRYSIGNKACKITMNIMAMPAYKTDNDGFFIATDLGSPVVNGGYLGAVINW